MLFKFKGRPKSSGNNLLNLLKALESDAKHARAWKTATGKYGADSESYGKLYVASVKRYCGDEIKPFKKARLKQEAADLRHLAGANRYTAALDSSEIQDEIYKLSQAALKAAATCVSQRNNEIRPEKLKPISGGWRELAWDAALQVLPTVVAAAPLFLSWWLAPLSWFIFYNGRVTIKHWARTSMDAYCRDQHRHTRDSYAHIHALRVELGFSLDDVRYISPTLVLRIVRRYAAEQQAKLAA